MMFGFNFFHLQFGWNPLNALFGNYQTSFKSSFESVTFFIKANFVGVVAAIVPNFLLAVVAANLSVSRQHRLRQSAKIASFFYMFLRGTFKSFRSMNSTADAFNIVT